MIDGVANRLDHRPAAELLGGWPAVLQLGRAIARFAPITEKSPIFFTGGGAEARA